MTNPTPEAVEAVAHVIHDNAYYVDGSDVAAVAVVEFIRDAIHRDGDDADAIRQALGLVWGQQTRYPTGHGRDRRVVGEWQERP